ncbi:hypothetical protein AAH979_22350 [Plantactinospora sp. ZYX-F-223]|uniref:hypothetical protein n=1 Tax=Plantactinospora sp. ZYX-F-223 TaxID=3144103 RepID=UPI0031FBEC60
MSDISADPDHLRGVAARLAELAGRVDVLSRGLSDGGAVPDRSQFPELPVGQQAATVWSDGNSAFVDGLSLVGQSLSRFTDGILAAAAGYEQADLRGADRMLRNLPGETHG